MKLRELPEAIGNLEVATAFNLLAIGISVIFLVNIATDILGALAHRKMIQKEIERMEKLHSEFSKFMEARRNGTASK